jgi:hypothetical protein
VPAANYRRNRSVRVDAPEIVMSRDELRSVLVAVDTAYEGARHHSDIGRIPFGPFEGLPRALRILRRHRDEVAT